jgi:hypothetical protein
MILKSFSHANELLQVLKKYYPTIYDGVWQHFSSVNTMKEDPDLLLIDTDDLYISEERGIQQFEFDTYLNKKTAFRFKSQPPK